MQHGAGKALQHTENGVRRLALFAHTHHFFALCAGVFIERQFYMDFILREFAHAQRQIDFFRVVVADGFVQLHQCAAFFGNHQ